MAEIKEYIAKSDESGSIVISEEVIASIASIAATEIDGVAGLGTSSVADFLGMKTPSKGVKITIGEDDTEILINLSVKKGYIIPTVAKAVQENVISAVESMTGMKVKSVNIKINDVVFEKEPKKKPATETK